MLHDVTERGASILRYKGAPGQSRVSMRHLDKALSSGEIPAHTFDQAEKLQAGEIVDIEIDLFPVGLVFHAGEQIRLIISGQSLQGGVMPGVRDFIPQNSGQHVIHTGGDHASYFQLPVQKGCD